MFTLTTLKLHASDLRNLTPTSGLFKSLERSKSSRQYPYIKRESSEDTLYLAERLSTQCNAQLRSISLEQDELKLTSSSNYVVYISIPALDSTGDTRLAAMAESGEFSYIPVIPIPIWINRWFALQSFGQHSLGHTWPSFCFHWFLLSFYQETARRFSRFYLGYFSEQYWRRNIQTLSTLHSWTHSQSLYCFLHSCTYPNVRC